MVNITLHGDKWVVKIVCTQCRERRIIQSHHRTKPWVAVESVAKTSARTLGWKVTNETAICGKCRRSK